MLLTDDAPFFTMESMRWWRAELCGTMPMKLAAPPTEEPIAIWSAA